MDGTLAQMIAITSYGHEYLKTGNTPGFYPGNSTFKYCQTVNFMENKKPFFFLKAKDVVVAEDPVAWFRSLKADKCTAINLYHLQQQWVIETVFRGIKEYWVAQWQPAPAAASGNNPWQVTYHKLTLHVKNTPVFTINDIVAQKERMGNILTDITTFANQHNLASWGNYFEKANQVLHSEAPAPNFYTDMLAEKNYPPAARQLLYAATSSNAFGGMGSWNDTGLDSDEYKRLSWDLYNGICLSIQMVLNARYSTN